ncbi:MAG TPA: hypothetical protein VHR41_12285 [Gemmatimonadales bacterium]|jgi:hypothetical protein|nr:hypothetical protein [Gemmatimonadales bacterium]
MREARLRPEFAHLYPALTPGEWEPAARIAEAVLANLLLQKMTDSPSPDRLLPEAHFEFRGGARQERDDLRERVDDGE